jgi:tripartite-type tricarboxylate transporter receptor subunit TctC
MGTCNVVRMLALVGLAGISVSLCHAQNYPSRTIRVIVPLSPGGGTDLVVRMASQQLSEQLGVAVIVDNRPGGGTVIGTEAIAKAAPDGYTLGGAAAELSINPSLRKLPYDTNKDFSCITQLTSGQYFLSTHPSVPVKSIRQFIVLAKSRPGEMTYGSSGPGSANHLAGVLLQQLTGIKLIHVPYKSGGHANTALLSGEIDFLFSNTASAIPHINSGRIRAIATTGRNRSSIAPDVPTVAESGVPQFDVRGFYLMLAPAGTPQAIVTKLNAELVKALNVPAIKNRLEQLGAEPVGGTPGACNQLITAEIAKWEPVVRESGAKVDR